MNSKVSCVLGGDNTCSSLSQWCGHSQHALNPVCVALPGCCPLHAGAVQTLTKLSGQSCCSAQPQPGKQEKPELPPHLWLIQAVPSAVTNQAHEGHSASPVLFPSLIPSLQSVPDVPVTEESHLLDDPKHPGSPEVPRLMAYMLAPSSTALVSASTRQKHGICLLSAPLLSGLSGSLPFILLGKMGKVKIWQHPTRKTPAFMEAVLEKFYISMEAEVHPSTSTSMLEDPFLPLLSPWKHLPQSTSPSRAWSSHYPAVAFPNQSRVPSEAWVPQRIRPGTFWFSILQSLLHFSAFNNPHSMPHFQI